MNSLLTLRGDRVGIIAHTFRKSLLDGGHGVTLIKSEVAA